MTSEVPDSKRSSPGRDFGEVRFSRVSLVAVFFVAPLAIGCTMQMDLGGPEARPSVANAANDPASKTDDDREGFGHDLIKTVAGRSQICPLSPPSEDDGCTAQNTAPCTYPAVDPRMASTVSIYICGLNRRWMYVTTGLAVFDALSCTQDAACTIAGMKCTHSCPSGIVACAQTCLCNGTSFECNAQVGTP